ncbi:MAG: hypothetical protein DRQ51_09605 [Gammaproteobacteria bacterium]|nr:MAG: hypothetical protein DRQ51_09605 [Gammaproteobacteria bacterium]
MWKDGFRVGARNDGTGWMDSVSEHGMTEQVGWIPCRSTSMTKKRARNDGVKGGSVHVESQARNDDKRCTK